MIAGEEPSPRATHGASAQPSASAASGRLAAIAREELDRRRRRGALIGGGLFADPAWEIMLLLYVREQEEGGADLEALHQSANIALTTLLRWIGLFVDAGIVVSVPVASTEHIHAVSLSRKGLEEMEQYLADCRSRSDHGDER